MKVFFSVLAVAAIVAPATGATVARPGLHGVVSRGPTLPVCVTDQPCSKPVPHMSVTFTRNGVSKTVTTDAQGRYAISLARGVYAVRIAVRARYTPMRVNVVAGRPRLLDFEIDTGIR